MDKSVSPLVERCQKPNELEKLLELSTQLDSELERIKQRINEMGLTEALPIEFDRHDFELRSGAYALAFDFAPTARMEDLTKMWDWLNLQNDESVLDVSAGTGFLSKYIATKVSTTVYALDPSAEQLTNLEKTKANLNIETVCGSPDDHSIFNNGKLAGKKFDVITSYGGIHHIINGQVEAFNNFADLLESGGRVVIGDVGGGSKLANHFETSVTENCLTSHVHKWVTEDRLKGELTQHNTLDLVRCEKVNVLWKFTSELQMALFMKALHADPRRPIEVVEDLNDKLGYKEEKSMFLLNWPMLFFELINRK